MSRVIQALLAGMLFTFILDFFLFLGIKLNYIDKFEIDLYYNILFADNQNIFLYLLLSIIFGFLIIYANNKISLLVTSIASLLIASTLIEPIGESVAEFMLMQKNVSLHYKNHTYIGDIYYKGRSDITFYDYKLEKIITLDKKNIKGVQ